MDSIVETNFGMIMTHDRITEGILKQQRKRITKTNDFEIGFLGWLLVFFNWLLGL